MVADNLDRKFSQANPRNNLTAEEVRALLDYDPATGAFTWRARPEHRGGYFTRLNRVKPGAYQEIKIRRVSYKAHRIAWLHYYGEWPSNVVDHINGVRGDNRIANLRDVGQSINTFNSKRRRDNEAGVKGVRFLKRIGRWQARIGIDGKNYHLGTFETSAEARAAYLGAAAVIYRKFGRSVNGFAPFNFPTAADSSDS